MSIRLDNSMPMFAMKQISLAQNKAAINMQRLASGSRINSATDDAAGLAIATGMTAKINGYNQSIRNANDGISLLQIGEGTLSEVTNVLQRMRELTVQAGNDTNSKLNRAAISQEINMLSSSIEDMMNGTKFNGTPLFSNQKDSFNIGLEDGGYTLNIGGFNYQKLALNNTPSNDETKDSNQSTTGLDVSSSEAVSESLKTLDQALLSITNERASYGAQQNRLGQTISQLSNSVINTQASRSRIFDTDYAAESTALVKNQLLMQTSGAMLVRFTQMQNKQILSLINSLK